MPPRNSGPFTIDKLDENWIEDDLRYRLIRSLIETIKFFRTISNVKIIVALRVDLVQSVFDKTRDSGFQEEKYQSLFHQINWSAPSLGKLLDARIAELCKEQYTSKAIKLNDIFPKMGTVQFLDHLVQRTLYRPRDAIAFVNECLKRSEGKGNVSVQTVREAEREYSAQRLESLSYEWINHYPHLMDYFSILERMPSKFKLSSITKEKIDELALKIGIDNANDADPVAKAAHTYLNNSSGSHHSVVIALSKALFKTGVLGLKPDGFTKVMWNFTSDRPPTDGQIKPASTAYLHPMVWDSLGTVIV